MFQARTLGRTYRVRNSIVPLLLALASLAHAQQQTSSFPQNLIDAAIDRTHQDVRYEGSYRSIDYPGGDVPSNIGVCTDVVIRSYRAIGEDLQVSVHEDMRASFSAYPDYWGLTQPDPNIDHRRVPNLQRYFERHGSDLPVTDNAADYRPGDLVTWMLPGNLPHIGIVVDLRAAGSARHLIVHNIGSGPKVEDILFRFPITGHYRYVPSEVH